jgi:Holliday junction resolvase RusA-like endonuclease
MMTLESAISNALRQEQKDFITEKLKHANEGLEIHLKLEFGFEMPQSYAKKKKERLRGKGHTNMVDLDNLIKNVQDRGNGILWSDDKYITSVTARKMWSDYNYIVIEIDYSTQ